MKVALLGTRGVPARYGGFETCVEECLLTGGKRSEELVFDRLSPSEKIVCKAAVAKERAKWEQFGDPPGGCHRPGGASGEDCRP